jgi:hypothetical protein
MGVFVGVSVGVAACRRFDLSLINPAGTLSALAETFKAEIIAEAGEGNAAAINATSKTMVEMRTLTG